ncbi:hypothetical protein [Thalassobacterium sedimentorum]|uniref:hypothetical protein n=1 Tax=Thalassobacterium sedimentorum TaxID=3041258 RepID=UPI002811DB6A|nr:hypothetical protein [Coraliomargarita sp. SDUM461004]
MVDNERVGVRSIRFFYYSSVSSDTIGEGDPFADFKFINDNEIDARALTPNALSEVISYDGAVPVELFREEMTESGVERIPLAELKFPREWKGVLFFVIRDSSNPHFGFKFFPIEYWGPSIPDHNIRVMNLCGKSMGFQIGKEKAKVPSLQFEDVPMSSGEQPMPFRIAMFDEDLGGRMLLSSMIPPFRSSRVLMITYPTGRSGTGVRTLNVTDLPGLSTER